MHKGDNIESLFDKSGNLTIQAIERYLSSSLNEEELAVVEKHLAENPFDREAVHGLRQLVPGCLMPDTIELGARVRSSLRERSSSRLHMKKASNYWYAAAAVILLIGVAGLYLIMNRETKTVNQLAVTTPSEITDTLPGPKPEDQVIGYSENETPENVDADNPEPVIPSPKSNYKTVTASDNKEVDESAEIIDEEVLPTTNQKVIDDNIIIESDLGISAEEENTDTDQIFMVVEDMPEFPGGEDSLYSYTAKNLTYPTEAKKSGIQGTVYVSFVVEADGSVTDPRVLRGIGGGCDEMALELVKNMPRWIPGKQRGKPIRVQYILPVKFRLE